MSLYSIGTQTNARRGKQNNGSGIVSRPEVAVCSDTEKVTSWCYLFIHHSKVDTVSKILEKQFPVFIHKSIVYKRENKRIRQEEKPTVSGLVFIQGHGKEIQELLGHCFSGLSLARDCSTYQIAVIPDSTMQPFMQVSEAAPTRIRFMPHTFGYYSAGNPLIRITTGILAGLEGYRIRIARDKCLVTSIGGMTVAIGGIHQESFENLDEYVHQRRESLKTDRKSSHITLTPLQQEIKKCVFTPQNQLDVMAMSESLAPWIIQVKSYLKNKNFDEAMEITLFLLEEIGICFRTRYNDSHIGDIKSILSVCQEADNALLAVIGSEDASVDLKDIVEAGRESLAIRFPFLPIK